MRHHPTHPKLLCGLCTRRSGSGRRGTRPPAAYLKGNQRGRARRHGCPSPPFVANPPCHHHHPFLAGVSFVFVTCPPPSLTEHSNTIAFHHHPPFITPPLLERMVEGLCPQPPPCPSPPPCPPPTLLSNTPPLLTPPLSLPLF